MENNGLYRRGQVLRDPPKAPMYSFNSFSYPQEIYSHLVTSSRNFMAEKTVLFLFIYLIVTGKKGKTKQDATTWPGNMFRIISPSRNICQVPDESTHWHRLIKQKTRSLYVIYNLWGKSDWRKNKAAGDHTWFLANTGKQLWRGKERMGSKYFIAFNFKKKDPFPDP